MQSSFVDIGLERDAFLYVTEVVNTVEEFERLAGDETKTRTTAANATTGRDAALAAADAALEEDARPADRRARPSEAPGPPERRSRDRAGANSEPRDDRRRAGRRAGGASRESKTC